MPELGDKPELPLDLEWYTGVWILLGQARPVGSSMVPEPIPFSSIADFCRLTRMRSIEDCLLLARFVLCIDTAWRGVHAERAERNAKKSGD